MVAVMSTSETSVNFRDSTRRSIPGDTCLYSQLFESEISNGEVEG
jgi:hypothetical protein